MELDVNDRTEVGSYFVANYPPFSAWSAEHVPAVQEVLGRPAEQVPLGLYLHIPFCRKRCKFCYFRVYTDKNSDDIETYLQALSQEVALYADQPALAGRTFEFVYFGGGTPSYLSIQQLERLVERIGAHWSWDRAREVTFECEPGTLKEGKVETIRSIGVTRLSLGVEHFDDEVLALNGRAHKSPEIRRCWEWIKRAEFDQVNVDLIAGMVGDTQEKWDRTVEETLRLDPDSVTIYQMELPFNTVFAREADDTSAAPSVADWSTKRRWVSEAFNRFESAGYVVSSGYTLVKPSSSGRFVYRDANWHGADMIGMGVASFSHLQGVHYQNHDRWEDYVEALQQGRLPLSRALPVTEHQRLIREMILQLKLGRIDAAYFQRKFGANILDTFGEAFSSLRDEGLADVDDGTITLSRKGLLRVDGLLPRFYEPAFRNVRYT
ncbi:MAG: coproporphyrinogen III oxidase family protein [Phycisphaerae bacterium]|nr:coproporphyrinogen III oxidase family protein [Phycisphaerae bacterium]